MAGDRSIFQKPFTIGEQVQALNRLFPGAQWRAERNGLVGGGIFSPTPLSGSYRLIFQYERKGRAGYDLKVLLSGDNVQKIDAPDFPHKYGIDKKRREVELCLFRRGEFTPRKLLAETIVPWAIEWLYFYEGWLATGKWLGGGEHPSVKRR